MAKALYRKYRPTKLDEIIGQEHITTTLKNSIDKGTLSHAYLLTGPRGVGKTSIARIIAHEINKLDYQDTSAHLDIIEIDAASNRRIDEIRELRDKVHILPSQVEYKVYIIDEVHMLTREAFNALLKTLEEPPKHAIFILATTEAHKLPDTIISRTQHFTFKPIDQANLVKHLRAIAKKEKINIDDQALELIAKHGDGSFRDSISLLDQMSTTNTDNITLSIVNQVLGQATPETITSLIDNLLQTDPKQLMTVLSELKEQGVSAKTLASQLSEELRTRIIDDQAYQQPRFVKLLEGIIYSSASTNPDRQLEIELLQFVLENNSNNTNTNTMVSTTPQKIQQQTETKTAKQNEPDAPDQQQAKPAERPKPKPKTEENEVPTKSTAKTTDKSDTTPTISDLNNDTWPQVLSAVKQKYNTLYGVLRMAETNVEGDKITLTFKFPFHKKKIDDQKNKTIITDLIRQQTGKNIKLVAELKQSEPTKKNSKEEKSKTITNVSDIFGGAELLES